MHRDPKQHQVTQESCVHILILITGNTEKQYQTPISSY